MGNTSLRFTLEYSGEVGGSRSSPKAGRDQVSIRLRDRGLLTPDTDPSQKSDNAEPPRVSTLDSISKTSHTYTIPLNRSRQTLFSFWHWRPPVEVGNAYVAPHA